MFGTPVQALKQACAIAIVSVGIITGAVGAAPSATAAPLIDRSDIVTAAQTAEERAAARAAWLQFRQSVQNARSQYRATMAALREEMRLALEAARSLPRSQRAAATMQARAEFFEGAMAAQTTLQQAIATAIDVLLNGGEEPPDDDPGDGVFT